MRENFYQAVIIVLLMTNGMQLGLLYWRKFLP